MTLLWGHRKGARISQGLSLKEGKKIPFQEVPGRKLNRVLRIRKKCCIYIWALFLLHTMVTTKIVSGQSTDLEGLNIWIYRWAVRLSHDWFRPLMSCPVNLERIEREYSVKGGGGWKERTAIDTQRRITSRPPTRYFQESVHMPA